MKTQQNPEIRLTIPVSAEVHAAFSRIAEATKMPVGRAMGEWLGDTLDAAQFMAETLEKARRAPKLVAQELHAYALGLGDESAELIQKIRKNGKAARATGADGKRSAAVTGDRAAATPLSNTGVNPSGRKSPKGGNHAA